MPDEPTLSSELSLDHVTQVRDMYRKDPGLSITQIASRLGVPRTTAKSLFDAAHRMEMELKDTFAAEAERVEESRKNIPAPPPAPAPVRDPDLFLRDRDTGAMFKLKIHKENAKRVVLELEDAAVQVGRGL